MRYRQTVGLKMASWEPAIVRRKRKISAAAKRNWLVGINYWSNQFQYSNSEKTRNHRVREGGKEGERYRIYSSFSSFPRSSWSLKSLSVVDWKDKKLVLGYVQQLASWKVFLPLFLDENDSLNQRTWTASCTYVDVQIRSGSIERKWAYKTGLQYVRDLSSSEPVGIDWSALCTTYYDLCHAQKLLFQG